jgi:hypothetical protein
MSGTQLQNLIEHFCQWVWSSFTDVSQTGQMHRVLDLLESANVAADGDRRGEALGHISCAIENTFGCESNEYRQFLHLYFPEQLAWKEHLRESGQQWDSPMTQQEAIAVMAKVKKRTAELRATSIC